jgi:predicted nucleotidyltransferase
MKIICKQLGGSHAYGTNVVDSDMDYRGVFLNDSINEIIGLDRFDHKITKIPRYWYSVKGSDYQYFELRQFLRHLRKANTTSLEILFNNTSIEKTDEWNFILQHRNLLLDTKSTFKCLMGYIGGEKKLFSGQRTGDVGSKRKTAIEKYGYSSKNYIHAIRLCWAGSVFFDTGIFPVRIADFDDALAMELIDVRQNPQKYRKDRLSRNIDMMETALKMSYDNRKVNFQFNHGVANELCMQLYMPILESQYERVVHKI